MMVFIIYIINELIFKLLLIEILVSIVLMPKMLESGIFWSKMVILTILKLVVFVTQFWNKLDFLYNIESLVFKKTIICVYNNL